LVCRGCGEEVEELASSGSEIAKARIGDPVSIACPKCKKALEKAPANMVPIID
jgi:hypothetical protein